MKIKKFIDSDLFKISLGLVFFVPALVTEHLGFLTAARILYILALLVVGYRVFLDAVRGILRRDLLDEKFLMSIASVGAMIVGEWSEGVAVMLFFLIGETFERLAVRRSRNSIKSLMDICPDEACVIVDGVESVVDAEDVTVGSTIIIRPGERVPIDSVVLEGSADIDTSAMTGEAIPVAVGVGSELSSGVVVLNGLLLCRTLRESSESAAARVLELVEYANENKSREESFITTFSHYYTPIVVIAALLLAILPPILSLNSWYESIYRALIFLVISCPCALVISVPMAFFGGIGGAASRGILYKGGNVFSKVAFADTVAFDKTGTVTSGEFTVSEVYPIGISREELLRLAASAEYASNHPIARSVKSAVNDFSLPEGAEEIAGEGMLATIGGDRIAVGNSALMSRIGVSVSDDSRRVGVLFVARNSTIVGTIYISDSIKSEAVDAISALRRSGIKKTVILSGDRYDNARAVGDALGIDEVYAELTPAEKYSRLEGLISESARGVMYVGDGINDAPSLARADVGIAMGKMGQDSAIEASDLVIMTDNLEKIPEARKIARKTLNIAKQNIVFALGVKGAILILGALGFANMWLAVFADVGVAVLAILNSMRALRARGK